MPLIMVYKIGGTAEEIGQLQTAFPDEHRLAGVRIKLERARDHLETLNREVSTFLRRRPYKIIEERRRGGRDLVFRVSIRETPPLAWSAGIGDCVQNMRAALEYLAWELARLDAPGEPPSKTGFPIYVDAQSYYATRKDGKPESWSGLKKVERIGKEAQYEIEASQPFNGRNDVLSGVSPGIVPHEVVEHGSWEVLWQRHPLWKLEQLAKSDRHRALRVIGATGTSYGGSRPSGSPEPEHVDVRLGPFKDGAIIARYSYSGPVCPGAYNSTGLTVNLQLQDEEEPRGWSVISTLGRMLDHIDANVIPRFERFF
jgi:hypothetical protein